MLNRHIVLYHIMSPVRMMPTPWLFSSWTSSSVPLIRAPMTSSGICLMFLRISRCLSLNDARYVMCYMVCCYWCDYLLWVVDGSVQLVCRSFCLGVVSMTSRGIRFLLRPIVEERRMLSTSAWLYHAIVLCHKCIYLSLSIYTYIYIYIYIHRLLLYDSIVYYNIRCYIIIYYIKLSTQPTQSRSSRFITMAS